MLTGLLWVFAYMVANYIVKKIVVDSLDVWRSVGGFLFALVAAWALSLGLLVGVGLALEQASVKLSLAGIPQFVGQSFWFAVAGAGVGVYQARRALKGEADASPSFMKWILYGALAFVAVGLGAAFLLPALLPGNTREPAIAQNTVVDDGYDFVVSGVEGLIDSGEIAVVPASLIADNAEVGGLWPASDAAALEAAQTWWRAGDDVKIYIPNNAPYSLRIIAFDYSNRPCADRAQNRRHNLKFSAPIPPGGRAVIVFNGGYIGLQKTGKSCLTIVNAWD